MRMGLSTAEHSSLPAEWWDRREGRRRRPVEAQVLPLGRDRLAGSEGAGSVAGSRRIEARKPGGRFSEGRQPVGNARLRADP